MMEQRLQGAKIKDREKISMLEKRQRNEGKENPC